MDDQARFDAMYREHGGAVRRYVHRRSDAQSADDVVADVFVVAWRRLNDVPDDPLPWLLGVARRVLANRRRGTAREDALRARMRSERLALPASVAREVTDAGRAVWEALNALSERDREVLLLVAWEGLSPARAARVLGIGSNTFAVRMYRARRRFRRALEAATGQEQQPPRTTEVMQWANPARSRRSSGDRSTHRPRSTTPTRSCGSRARRRRRQAATCGSKRNG